MGQAQRLARLSDIESGIHIDVLLADEAVLHPCLLGLLVFEKLPGLQCVKLGLMNAGLMDRHGVVHHLFSLGLGADPGFNGFCHGVLPYLMLL